jgi:hypothetical protein
VTIEADVQAGMYSIMCSQQWKPKLRNLGHARQSRDLEHEPILQTGTDRFVSKYAYHKPITVKFLVKCERQNGFKVDIKGGLALYTDGSEVNKGTGDGVHRWGSRRGHRFSRGLHTTILQAEIYPI